jgi:hypothetical protein
MLYRFRTLAPSDIVVVRACTKNAGFSGNCGEYGNVPVENCYPNWISVSDLSLHVV